MANVLLCLFCFLLYITRKEKSEKAARFPEAAVVFEIFINLDLSFADLKHIRWALFDVQSVHVKACISSTGRVLLQRACIFDGALRGR